MRVRPFKHGAFNKREAAFLEAVGEEASFRELQARLKLSIAPVQMMIANLVRKEALRIV
jgi:DNA-binding CsgD family transcriptional regulator